MWILQREAQTVPGSWEGSPTLAVQAEQGKYKDTFRIRYLLWKCIQYRAVETKFFMSSMVYWFTTDQYHTTTPKRDPVNEAILMNRQRTSISHSRRFSNLRDTEVNNQKQLADSYWGRTNGRNKREPEFKKKSTENFHRNAIRIYITKGQGLH